MKTVFVFFWLGMIISNRQQNPTELQQVLPGSWKVNKVYYLDRQGMNPEQGKDLIFHFTDDGFCLNKKENSRVKYTLEGSRIDMNGYIWIVESFSEKELVVREDKLFFVRKLILEKL
jgi:hypothetical protein